MRFASVVLVLAIAACGRADRAAPAPAARDSARAEPPVVCGLQSLPGITVYVRDARTGAAPDTAVTLVVREGAYTDSTHTGTDLNGPGTLFAAWDRPGTYAVTVRAPGYAPWTREGIDVPRGRCNVRGVQIRAVLTPRP